VVPPGSGLFTSDMALDPANGELFVTTEGGDLVVVNTTSDRLSDVLSLPGVLYGIAYDAANNEIYVAHPYDSSFVLVLNATTDAEIGTVNVGSIPVGIAVDPSNGRIYVANYNSSTVSVVNGTNDQVVTNISVESGPFYLAVDPAAGEIAVTDYGADQVTFINTTTDRATDNVSVGIVPTGITYDPVNRDVYVVNCGPGCITPGGSNGSVDVLNGTSASLIKSIQVGVCPGQATFDSLTDEVLVADSTCTAPSLGNLSVIDPSTNSVVRTVSMGEYPWGVTADQANGLVYVTNYYSDNVTIVNGTTWATVGAVGSGEFPSRATFDPENGTVYVADWGGNDVAVLNGTTGVEDEDLGSWYGPDAVAYDSSTGDLYVANSESNNVSVFDASTGKIVASDPVGSYPDGIVYDPANGDVYVANCNSDNVSIVDGENNSIVGTVAAGSCPLAFALDPVGDTVLVANRGPLVEYEFITENVTVISGATNQRVGSIPVGGVPLGIAYDPRNDQVYVENAFSDNLTVINGSTLQPVISIPLGPTWTLQSSGLAFSSTRDELLVPFLNGNLGVINPVTNRFIGNTSVTWASTWVMVDGSTGLVFVLNPSLGTASILSLAEYPPPEYSVVFHGAGFGPGTTWSVTFNGTTNESTSDLIGFEVTNGSYAFNVIAVPGYEALTLNGQVNVSGRNESVTIAFDRLYSANFTESGLPGGTFWTVSIGGLIAGSTNTSLQFELPNGTYTYSVTAIPGFAAKLSGQDVVNGAGFSQEVNFTQLTYAVTFEQTGLPSGTGWNVTLAGVERESVGTAIVFLEPDGTFNYSIDGISGWHQTSIPYSGIIIVTGSAVAEPTLAFTQVTYLVTISESGLPSGTNWSVTLDGHTSSSSTREVNFTEPNGTFTFAVAPVPEYNATPASSSVIVEGANASRKVSFSFIPVTTKTAGGVPPLEVYALIGGGVLVLVAIAFAVVIRKSRDGKSVPKAVTSESSKPPPPAT
jgi:YVTN family beta-propeller protein